MFVGQVTYVPTPKEHMFVSQVTYVPYGRFLCDLLI